MTALTDQLAAARLEADNATKIAREVVKHPAADLREDVAALAAALAVLGAAVLALADYTETPL